MYKTMKRLLTVILTVCMLGTSIDFPVLAADTAAVAANYATGAEIAEVAEVETETIADVSGSDVSGADDIGEEAGDDEGDAQGGDAESGDTDSDEADDVSAGDEGEDELTTAGEDGLQTPEGYDAPGLVIRGDTSVSGTGYSYNASTRILTLNNYHGTVPIYLGAYFYEKSQAGESGYAIDNGKYAIAVELKGENTINPGAVGTGLVLYYYAYLIGDGKLTISGGYRGIRNYSHFYTGIHYDSTLHASFSSPNLVIENCTYGIDPYVETSGADSFANVGVTRGNVYIHTTNNAIAHCYFSSNGTTTLISDTTYAFYANYTTFHAGTGKLTAISKATTGCAAIKDCNVEISNCDAYISGPKGIYLERNTNCNYNYAKIETTGIFTNNVYIEGTESYAIEGCNGTGFRVLSGNADLIGKTAVASGVSLSLMTSDILYGDDVENLYSVGSALTNKVMRIGEGYSYPEVVGEDESGVINHDIKIDVSGTTESYAYNTYKYDASTKTLTLKNAKMVGSIIIGNDDDPFANPRNYTLVLEGNSYIVHDSNYNGGNVAKVDNKTGISCRENLTIKGKGKLTMKEYGTFVSNIFVKGALTIQDVTLDLDASMGDFCIGAYKLTIKSGTINAFFKNNTYGSAIDVGSDLLISGGTVYADASNCSCGIVVARGYKQTGGTVTAIGLTNGSGANCSGITAQDFELSGGKLDVSGKIGVKLTTVSDQHVARFTGGEATIESSTAGVNGYAHFEKGNFIISSNTAAISGGAVTLGSGGYAYVGTGIDDAELLQGDYASQKFFYYRGAAGQAEPGMTFSRFADKSGKGYSFNAATRTLTLTNYTGSSEIILPKEGSSNEYTIKLVGTNKITISRTETNAITANAPLKITGSGSLTITGGKALRGIYCGSENDLQIENVYLKISTVREALFGRNITIDGGKSILSSSRLDAIYFQNSTSINGDALFYLKGCGCGVNTEKFRGQLSISSSARGDIEGAMTALGTNVRINSDSYVFGGDSRGTLTATFYNTLKYLRVNAGFYIDSKGNEKNGQTPSKLTISQTKSQKTMYTGMTKYAVGKVVFDSATTAPFNTDDYLSVSVCTTNKNKKDDLGVASVSIENGVLYLSANDRSGLVFPVTATITVSAKNPGYLAEKRAIATTATATVTIKQSLYDLSIATPKTLYYTKGTDAKLQLGLTYNEGNAKPANTSVTWKIGSGFDEDGNVIPFAKNSPEYKKITIANGKITINKKYNPTGTGKTLAVSVTGKGANGEVISDKTSVSVVFDYVKPKAIVFTSTSNTIIAVNGSSLPIDQIEFANVCVVSRTGYKVGDELSIDDVVTVQPIARKSSFSYATITDENSLVITKPGTVTFTYMYSDGRSIKAKLTVKKRSMSAFQGLFYADSFFDKNTYVSNGETMEVSRYGNTPFALGYGFATRFEDVNGSVKLDGLKKTGTASMSQDGFNVTVNTYVFTKKTATVRITKGDITQEFTLVNKAYEDAALAAAPTVTPKQTVNSNTIYDQTIHFQISRAIPGLKYVIIGKANAMDTNRNSYSLLGNGTRVEVDETGGFDLKIPASNRNLRKEEKLCFTFLDAEGNILCKSAKATLKTKSAKNSFALADKVTIDSRKESKAANLKISKGNVRDYDFYYLKNAVSGGIANHFTDYYEIISTTNGDYYVKLRDGVTADDIKALKSKKCKDNVGYVTFEVAYGDREDPIYITKKITVTVK